MSKDTSYLSAAYKDLPPPRYERLIHGNFPEDLIFSEEQKKHYCDMGFKLKEWDHDSSN